MYNKTKDKSIYKSIFNEADRTSVQYGMMTVFTILAGEQKINIIKYKT